MTTISAVSTRPTTVAPKSRSGVSSGSADAKLPVMRSVMNQKPIADRMPATASPLYSAFMILPPGVALTK